MMDNKVAEYILEEITDGCCIQLGIGGMPNAVVWRSPPLT